MKTYFTIVLICSATLLSRLAIAQGTITIGVVGSVHAEPFGGGFTGEYQQIYASADFPAAIQITQIAFAYYFPSSAAANYNLSVGLGATTKTPTSLGTSFGTGFSTVFSGSLSPVFTSTAGDFDLMINLASPFTYDPSQGNLLLDVMVFSANGGTLFEAQDVFAPNMGALWTSGKSLVTEPGGGLITQFTVIPEPSVVSLIFLSSGVLFYARRKFIH
jgi:hypothetical protein